MNIPGSAYLPSEERQYIIVLVPTGLLVCEAPELLTTVNILSNNASHQSLRLLALHGLQTSPDQVGNGVCRLFPNRTVRARHPGNDQHVPALALLNPLSIKDGAGAMPPLMSHPTK